MADWNNRANELFLQAAEMQGPGERRHFLDQQCGNDGALRQQVESLLAASAKVGSFLNEPASGAATAALPPVAEGPGTVIGPYKLMEQIGEGGFGVVFVAEQQHPVRRKVALKLIKPGMDSKPIIARFEAERQALAMMDHQNVAKVYDAGATDSGRLYFVMELVHGIPITEYCDANKLTPRQRLELFVPVCHAIQHAHQKGIIHRDIKPSNILVTMYDDKPVPKVIDFGVAKAIEQRLTEKTVYTQFGTLVGTFEYMSPEQAEMNAFGVDTRSDVYALGVLLYELLTGTTPLERPRLREAAFDEIRRLIKEEEPPRPSVRLSTSATLAKVAAARQTDPAKLSKLVRGELDWVVMKCLEKDRTRRYETANGLARDVERYLKDEPVEACPPSMGYRLGKVMRKHRRPLMTAAAFAVVLLVGGGLLGWQAVRLARAERDQANRERDQAVQQADREREVREALAQASTLREQARRDSDLSKWADARAFGKRAEGLLEIGPVDEDLTAQVRTLMSELEVEVNERRLLARLDDIRLRRADMFTDHGMVFQFHLTIPEYAAAFREYGVFAGATRPEEIAHQFRRRPEAFRAALLEGLSDWFWHADIFKAEEAVWLRQVLAAADPDEWRTRARAAQAARDVPAMEKLASEVDVTRQPPGALDRLAFRLADANRDEASLELRIRIHQRYPADYWNTYFLAMAHLQKQPAEAVRFYTAALALRPNNPNVLIRYGAALRKNGDLKEAVAAYRRAIELKPDYSPPYLHLASILKERGDAAEAAACYDRVVALNRDKPENLAWVVRTFRWEKDWETALMLARKAVELAPNSAQAHLALGSALNMLRNLPEAIASFRKAIELDPRNARAHFDLGNALLAQKDLPAAIESYRTALQHDPKHAWAHVQLGIALRRQGDLPRAIECFQEALKHKPGFDQAHLALGQASWAQGDLPAAIDSMREALKSRRIETQVRKSLAQLLHQQGLKLIKQGMLEDAAACYREAIDHDPEYLPLHVNLGFVSRKLGDTAGAVASYRKAAELEPNNASGHNILGNLLRDQGDLAGAVASFRKAVELEPTEFSLHNNLGSALLDQGDMTGALASLRKAIELNPKFALAYMNVGLVQWVQVDFAGALVSFRKAIEVAPKYAYAHGSLGLGLRLQGDFAGARAAYENSRDLRAKEQTAKSPFPAEESIRRCERILALEARLPAILQGEFRPVDAAEGIACAELCRARKHHAAATRLYAEAFAADASLGENLFSNDRYLALTSAALAGCGQGSDAKTLAAAEQARCRRQAREWLQANMKLLPKMLASGKLDERRTVLRILPYYQHDRDLAGVRDAEALAKLPDEERQEWQQFWDDVARVLGKARQAP